MKVVIVNCQDQNRRKAQLVAAILRHTPAVVLASEAFWLRRLPGYRRLGGKARAGHGANDCAIFVRLDLIVDDWYLDQVTDPVPHHAKQHDRWVVWAKVRRPGHRRVWAFCSYHGNPGGALAKQYFGYLETLALLFDSTSRYLVVFGGDGNLWPGSGRWSPDSVFALAGLTYKSHGLDGLAYDQQLELESWKAHRAPGVDDPHALIVARLAIRP